MNKEKELLIREKTEILFKLERSFQSLGIINADGKSFNELKDERIYYELYRAKVFEAEQELLAAQRI
jgi:hypothetical protein